MLKDIINNAEVFSLNDLSDIAEMLDNWAFERAGLGRRHIGDDEQAMYAYAEPRFSKVELQSGLEIVLDAAIARALV